jgi:hypothetical protein
LLRDDADAIAIFDMPLPAAAAMLFFFFRALPPAFAMPFRFRHLPMLFRAMLPYEH